MGVITNYQYKSYAKKIISAGNECQKAAGSFRKSIEKTIPKQFAGKTAEKVEFVASEIITALNTTGKNIENIGYGVRSIVNNNDID